jgi:hypothetical protein
MRLAATFIEGIAASRCRRRTVEQRVIVADEPEIVSDGEILEREVETIRTREAIAGAGLDAADASVTNVAEQRYVDTLPERMSDLGFVLRASVLGLLAIRFLLHASGANQASGFGAFVDGASWVFASPFANLFSNSSAGPGTIEFSTLVAMVVWALIFVLLRRLLRAVAPSLRTDAPRRSIVTRWTSRRLVPATTAVEVESVANASSPPVERTHRRRYRLTRPRRA